MSCSTGYHHAWRSSSILGLTHARTRAPAHPRAVAVVEANAERSGFVKKDASQGRAEKPKMEGRNREDLTDNRHPLARITASYVACPKFDNQTKFALCTAVLELVRSTG